MNKTERQCRRCDTSFNVEFGRWNQQYCTPHCKQLVKKETTNKYIKKNAAKIRKYRRDYYRKKAKIDPTLREKSNSRSKKYYQRHKEELMDKQREYYTRNKVSILKNRQRWWKTRGKKLVRAHKNNEEVALLKRGRPRKK